MFDLLTFVVTCQDFNTYISQICFCGFVSNTYGSLSVTFTCFMITDT